MVKKYVISLFTAAATLLWFASTSSAQTIAYDAAVQAGNQAFTGNLGLDFNVTAPIAVTSLGAFDNNADGFTGTVVVGIFDRSTMALVAGPVSFTGATGTLINGDQFTALSSPVILPVGTYSVVAVGFNATDLNVNSNVGGTFTLPTENAGGAISFVGTGRYDSNTTLDFPTTVPSGTPSNIFAAGTFQFTAISAPTLTKTFGAPFITVGGGATTLTFTLSNPNTAPLTGLAFTDTLPAGVAITTPSDLTGSCGGGSIFTEETIMGGVITSSSISLAGATLAGGTSCTFSVKVKGLAGGVAVNTTSTVTSNEASAGAAATATIQVIFADAFQIGYAANLNAGDSFLDITNTGATVATGVSQNLCVNLYTFDPEEELISCCTCSVTPNGLQSLSALTSLISNPLTPAIPSSVVIKVVASSSATCDASSVTGASVAAGLLVWGTTLHQNTSTAVPSYSVTETPFSRSALSEAELAHITSTCGFIKSNGSKFGICGGCAGGGLGASQSSQ
jgi:uncharacterized repeat protein (TIGR01451 family)